MNRVLRWASSDRGDADPLMTVISIGISTILTTAVAGALSVIVLVGSGFVGTSALRGDVDEAQQLWSTTMQNASSVSVYGTTKVVAYAYPDSRPGLYQATAQDQTCAKTTWQFTGGRITATVDRWSNDDCDRTITAAAPTSSVTAVDLGGATAAISVENGGLRDLHFDSAGTEVGLITTDTALKSTNPKTTNPVNGKVVVSAAEWSSTVPKSVNVTGKVTALGGDVKLNWLGTTMLRPSISTTSVDEGLRFTPLAPMQRFTVGSVSSTPLVVTVAGVGSIPADAAAVTFSLQVTPSAAGSVRVTPAGSDASIATAVMQKDVPVSATSTVALTGGKLQVTASAGSSPAFIDVSGYYSTSSSGSTYTPLADARAWSGTVTTTDVNVTLAGVGGIPADATAVAMNVYVGLPTAAGYARISPYGKSATTTQQNFQANLSSANYITVGLASGKVTVKLSAGSATVHFDVSGYYSSSASGATFVPLPIARSWSGTLTNADTKIAVANTSGIPGNAVAVASNLQVSSTSAKSYYKVVSKDTSVDVMGQLFAVSSSASGYQQTMLAPDGSVVAKLNAGTATAYYDVFGYFQPAK
ncbi:hypothetical protein [Curtobacterium sp. MCSS17_016]|uniref:hypothetical protein n=1 Tax=Curtobacterium sp. MCSS17_016 TaxID=2175644 RepID=UPI000DA8B23B|nr:hypothetical protein [Curtobacterium sp. MCSS17_016]WIE80847.1 hypothetical protein DEJ19_020235 [Curtobacterium sp. MCSS17_016]